MDNTGTGTGGKWLRMADIPDIDKSDIIGCQLQKEMDYWSYEMECREYWGIGYAPTDRQYLCFLKYHKFKNIGA